MTLENRLLPTVEAIEHSDLTDKTYARLRHYIVSGRYAIGARLQITTLAEQLKVSHTPVKIALNRLAAEGLVENASRRGMFVTRVCRKELDESQQVRLLLEVHAISVAVERMGEKELAELRSILDELTVLVEHIPANGWDTEKAAVLNDAFHQKIIEAAGNGKLLEVWRGLQTQQQIARINSLSQVVSTANAADVLEGHKIIFEAIAARDGEKARSLIGTHIAASAAALTQRIDELDHAPGAG
ncbi:MAG: GntR family transcriptional regulator [Bacteroidetes bacterium]|nr:GntR family transcriptional regulator [Bacteroidota bacterium]